VDEPRPLTSYDVEVRTIAAELVPPDALRRVDDAIGLTPRAPLLRGQLVLERAVAPELVEMRGWPIDPTFRAVAIPVRAIDAIGGAIVPGSRVDVLAMPIAGRS